MRWRVQIIASSQPVATEDPSRSRSARTHSSSQPVSRRSQREVISSRIMFIIVILVLCAVHSIMINVFPIFFIKYPKLMGNFPYFWEICFPYSFFPFCFPDSDIVS